MDLWIPFNSASEIALKNSFLCRIGFDIDTFTSSIEPATRTSNLDDSSSLFRSVSFSSSLSKKQEP